jgi:LuxR family glucitol operon transcriptional activator
VELANLAEGLDSFHSLLVVEGLGGVGKTTLVIEVAYQCLWGSDLMPNSLFDAAVWVSARGQLDQKLWLNDVLSTIARVLDYHSVAQLEFDEKRAKVTELLHTYQTLVIIDNFDTIDDPGLLDWIQQIPEPSKVLVTSRDAHQLYQGWTLHLEGLKGDDALELIRYHIQKLQLSVMESTEVNDLLHVTHGNPLAIAMTLGDLKSGGLSLYQVLDGLRSAGNILDHLLRRQR